MVTEGALPELCAVFGPLQEFPDRDTSLEDEVRLGEQGFLGEAGRGRTAVASLGLSFGRTAGDGQAVAEYLSRVRAHRETGEQPMPVATDEILDSARAVDDAISAEQCVGWAPPP